MIAFSLQQKLSQQLSLTPQLRLAIRLLLLSTVELQQEIQTALEQNPLLEIDDLFTEIKSEEAKDEELDIREFMDDPNIREDIPLDASLDDIYTAGTPSGTHSEYYNEELPIYQGETQQTLIDYLKWQLDLTPFNDIDRGIALFIIQAIDERGYLTVSLNEILEEKNNKEIELAEIETVLKRIWHFDPFGVGSRSLKEYLMIQTQQLNPPLFVEQIIANHLDLVANRDFRKLKKILACNEVQLKNAIDFIKNLQPYPCVTLPTSNADYVIPDVIVNKIAGKWQVMLNTDTLPKLCINQHYANMANVANQKDSDYIRSCHQAASWLIKSIETRNQTLKKVSDFIVNHQQDFFEYGIESMKPMVLADVALAIDMHESTISRVTTQKFLYCPAGIFELKFFFSSHINTDSGDNASSTAIQALIKKIIATEDNKKPLSDSKLVKILAQQGIIIARRTVAKYRESLFIPASNHRKQL